MSLSKELAISPKIQFICIFVLLGLLSLATQLGFAQSPDPSLNFGNNFFVTGDYAVGGVSLAGQANKIYPGYAVGTISMGADKNPGVTGNNSVPQGAEIVAALVYWQTIEIIGGSTGQNGFFRPVFSGGPATGYVMQGTPLKNPNGPVYWDGSGCTAGKSTPKQLVTYLAVVTPYLRQDPKGNVLAGNTATPQNYEVKLPSQSNGSPLTLGATLVLIYRVMSPSFPLNSIVIYDGSNSPSTSAQPRGALDRDSHDLGSLTTTNTIQGFYQSDGSKSKLTYIVGNGQQNESETVSLNGSGLPSVYTSQPPFPGWYSGGLWDNVTWTFPNNKVNPPNPVPAGSSAATNSWPSQSVSTAVTPAKAQCVTPAAIIFSTTVSDPDYDGLPPVLKNSRGYCDPAINNGSCNFGNSTDPAFVSLDDPLDPPQSGTGRKDVFAQIDYMVDSSGTNPLLNQTDVNAAIKRVQNAFLGPVENRGNNKLHNVHLHLSLGNPSQSYSGAITAQDCRDGVTVPGLCSFPTAPGDVGGVVGWKGNFAGIKNQLVLGGDPTQCTSTPPTAGCQPRFQHGRKDAYHYVMLGRAPGLAQWFMVGGTLAVKQTGNAVTFTTSTPHGPLDAVGVVALKRSGGLSSVDPVTGLQTGLAPPGDPSCTNGRVTIVGAASNPNLNGTYCVQNPTDTTFTVNIGGSAANTSYTPLTDPNLAVAPGYVTQASGVSDVGGEDSLITLASWGTNATQKIIANTVMHELGHSNALTHGGYSFPNSGSGDYRPAVESNCKANFQSVMNYTFQLQFAPLQFLTGYDASNNPLLLDVVDYSEQPLDTLNESAVGVANVFTADPFYFFTGWYRPKTDGVPGTPGYIHCDGTPITDNAQYVLQTGPANEPAMPLCPFCNPSLSWLAGEDINFDGFRTETLHGYNDWANVNFDQVGATGSLSSTGGGLVAQGGGLVAQGGGLVAQGGGLVAQGGGLVAQGGGLVAQGGGLVAQGGGLVAQGGAEINLATANSVTRPPTQLFATEDVSPRYIHLTWTAPSFGAIDRYNIYRQPPFASGSPLTVQASSLTFNSAKNQYTYIDKTAACNTGGYTYAVSALLQGTDQESAQSNSVNTTTAGKKLTGCYTNTPPTVTLNNLSFGLPNPAVQGSIVPITWTLQDDDTATYVANLNANTLVANGPVSSDNCTTVTQGSMNLLVNGVPQMVNGSPAGTFGRNGNQFTFTWNTDAFCAGSYNFTLNLDSKQSETTASALPLQIDINDSDSTPHVTTLALPAGTVGLAYTPYTLTEDGGTPRFTWTVTGLPSGISQQPASSPTLSGTTCAAGSYNPTATVTDSKSNSGTQPLTLQINKANTTTVITSNANPSVFQQMVTFTVTVTPQYGCTPTGTVTLFDTGSPIASSALPPSGIVTFMTSALSVGVHSITAGYSGDANFNISNGALSPSQTVNKAPTQVSFNSVSPSPVFVGQPVTISYTFSVVVAGTGSPIAPSGNIMVSASDGSSCMAAAVQGAGMCTLSPAPTAPGNVTYTVTYLGDGNFVASGFNRNYTVYKLVFTTQPSNTGVGLTITPPVVVTAEDNSNTTFTGFTGGITVAIGSGPGTLSGTTTQNAVSGVATFGDLSINKIANGYTLTASPGGVPDATSSAFNIDTFYVDGSGNFGTLDLASGTATQIGAGTAPSSTGMDLTPGLLVYEYNTSTNQLVEITPSTGAATPVGSAGSIPDQATAGPLTNGSYFGIDMVNGNLYSIDLTTGVTTSVGTTTTALVPAGCSFEASLTGSASVLYYTIGSTGVGTSCTAFTDTLYQINPTNGATTTIGPVTISGSGVNAFVGSAFVGGTLYGFTPTSGGQEYTIDPGTGVATLVTNTTVPIVGAGSSQ